MTSWLVRMIGSDLKQWRAALGWTQQRAADELGVKQPYYAELESGRRDPLRRVYALACAELTRRFSGHRR